MRMSHAQLSGRKDSFTGTAEYLHPELLNDRQQSAALDIRSSAMLFSYELENVVPGPISSIKTLPTTEYDLDAPRDPLFFSKVIEAFLLSTQRKE
jgi:hypothetical protein